jgi:hypothetical protein
MTMSIIRKMASGGQTGTDCAALDFAMTAVASRRLELLE